MSALGVGSVAHVLFVVGSCCLGVGLTALGIGCMVSPSTAAELYGIPRSVEQAAWVQVAGLRDLALGVAALALFVWERRAMRVYTLILLPLPIGDALLTLHHGGSPVGAATHLAGVCAVGTLAVCAWLDPSLKTKAE